MRSPQAQMAKMESMLHQIKVSIILQMCVFLVFSFKLYIFYIQIINSCESIFVPFLGYNIYNGIEATKSFQNEVKANHVRHTSILVWEGV